MLQNVELNLFCVGGVPLRCNRSDLNTILKPSLHITTQSPPERGAVAQWIVCANHPHPAAPGSNPEHNVYVFFQFILKLCVSKGRKYTNRGRDWLVFIQRLDQVTFRETTRLAQRRFGMAAQKTFAKLMANNKMSRLPIWEIALTLVL